MDRTADRRTDGCHGGNEGSARRDLHGAPDGPLKRSRPVSLDALRARLSALHGPRRAAAAYQLALLAAAAEVLSMAVARRERMAAHFVECWEAEDARAWLVQWDHEGKSYGQRPLWEAATWRAQAALAECIATETEWYQTVGDLLRHAGAAVDELRPRKRAIVVFGDDGEAKTLFHVTRGEIVE